MTSLRPWLLQCSWYLPRVICQEAGAVGFLADWGACGSVVAVPEAWRGGWMCGGQVAGLGWPGIQSGRPSGGWAGGWVEEGLVGLAGVDGLLHCVVDFEDHPLVAGFADSPSSL